jgi:hypothetical protein
LKKTVSLSTERQITQLGLFPNGDVLVSGVSFPRNGGGRKSLEIFNGNGEFQKSLFQDNPDYDVKDVKDFLDASPKRILPYRKHLLLEYHEGNKVNLKEVNPAGLLYEYTVELPAGYSPMSLISSDGPYWYLLSGKSSGSAGSSIKVDDIFVFDRLTSKMVRHLQGNDSAHLLNTLSITEGELLVLAYRDGKSCLLRGSMGK